MEIHEISEDLYEEADTCWSSAFLCAAKDISHRRLVQLFEVVHVNHHSDWYPSCCHAMFECYPDHGK